MCLQIKSVSSDFKTDLSNDLWLKTAATKSNISCIEIYELSHQTGCSYHCHKTVNTKLSWFDMVQQQAFIDNCH